MKKSLLVLAASIAAAVSMNASAATVGTINFQGSVINATCQIATASDNQTITLPQITSSDFTAVNQTRGQIVPFQITLSGCDAATPGNVAVAFDFVPAASYNDVIQNTGTATGVGIRIHDSSAKTISMAGTEFYATPKALATGDVVFDFDAEYYSTAATVTPGSVVATATIEVVYP